MSTRYTATFEWEGEPPGVTALDGWLGGRLVWLSFDEELGSLESEVLPTNAQMAAAIDRGLAQRAQETAGPREFHEVVIDGRTYRTTSQKLVEEIQRQDLEIQEMNGRLIAANRTLQNVRGQLATAQNNAAIHRMQRAPLTNDEANDVIKRTAPWTGPNTADIVRDVVGAADDVRASRTAPLPTPTAVVHMPFCPISSPLPPKAKREAPDDTPGLADALAHAATLEEEHRYLASALLSRCGPRKTGETWVDYARRTMGQS